MLNLTGHDATEIAKREDEGVVVHLEDHLGNPLFFGEEKKPVTVRIAGTYSKRYRTMLRAVRTRGLKQQISKVTAELLEQNEAELVAGCIMEWQGVGENNVAAPCTLENARILVAAPWFIEQLKDAQKDHASFFANSSAS